MPLLFAGCVTSVTVDESLQPAVDTTPVVIDLPTGSPSGDDRVARELYQSAFARMQGAYVDRDIGQLQALLGTFQPGSAPAWARSQLLGFRALAAGLQFELHAAQRATIAAPGAMPADIGTALDLELSLPPLAGAEVTLGGRSDDDAVAFAVTVLVRDRFLDGSSGRQSDGDVVRLPAAVVLRDEALRLPVHLDLGPSAAVRRDIDVRVDLMPGHVQNGDERAPVRRTTLAATTVVQWPAGHATLRQEPLARLRAALGQSDDKALLTVRLAAEFAPPADRPAVEAALIDWIRIGSARQATVAMAALRSIGAADIALGDRDAWLAWWQAMR